MPWEAFGKATDIEDAGASFAVGATTGDATPGWDTMGLACGLASVANDRAEPSTVGDGVISAVGWTLASEMVDATGFLLGERARACVGDGRVASSK